MVESEQIGTQEFWKFSNQILNKGKVLVLTVINALELSHPYQKW